jgi:hypothetical protein
MRPFQSETSEKINCSARSVSVTTTPHLRCYMHLTRGAQEFLAPLQERHAEAER